MKRSGTIYFSPLLRTLRLGVRTFDLQYNIHRAIKCVPALVVGGREPYVLLALYSEEVYIFKTEPCTDYELVLFVSLSDSAM